MVVEIDVLITGLLISGATVIIMLNISRLEANAAVIDAGADSGI